MGTVHVVATPIGNLEDITLRALRILAEADCIFAEDTRRTRILLDHHGIATRPSSLGTHNEEARIEGALERLRGGASIALVSDAGTPLVSDPGARLVAAAAADGHRVEAIPGPSAILAALSVSGLRVHPFTFAGFLPRKRGARKKLLEVHARRRETLVLFESPHRIAETLTELVEIFGPERPACLARELTKLHEEIARGGLAELAARFAEGARGEVTLVVEGAPAEESAAAELEEMDVDAEIRALIAAGKRPREIAAQLAGPSGLPRRTIYARAVAAREGGEGAQSGSAADREVGTP
jgi:16S rRNA (cytidine1402-2'-O)-methyltransferase